MQPCLETRIGLARIVQKPREFQVRNTLGRKADGFREVCRLVFHVSTVLLQRQGKAGDGAARVVLGRAGAAVFLFFFALNSERRHEDNAARTPFRRSIEIKISGNAFLSPGVIEHGEIIVNILREVQTGKSRP